MTTIAADQRHPQVMQNAHDVMQITENQVFQPLYSITLQGGGGRRGEAANLSEYVNERAIRRKNRESGSKRETANIERVRRIVRRIKKLYGKLKIETRKVFPTQAAYAQASELIQSLSTRLFDAVGVFTRNLAKIKQLPSAVVAKAMRGLPTSWADFKRRYVTGRRVAAAPASASAPAPAPRRGPHRAARSRSPRYK